MKKILATFILLAGMLAANHARAASDNVSLGFTFGAAFPQHSTSEVQFDDWDSSFSWGFYVNIPVVWTFHIAPTTTLYQFRSVNATDVDLAFKFLIPVWRIQLFFGVAPGVTTVADDHMFNVGGLAGCSFNFVSNLDAFVEARYKILIEGDQNIRVLHTFAGLLWHF
ncbi:MAG: hypothetical protein D6806_15995 [Deltaproteobacteria bacterium]|nr:MAG: hypothetical protein D6806_15995 [Deltaproteobacteria bacterium]